MLNSDYNEWQWIEYFKWIKSVVCGLYLNKTVKKMQLKYKIYMYMYVCIYTHMKRV